MLPSEFPEVQSYPNLKTLLEVHVDMQFVDVRTMLRLPMQENGLSGGCNFAAAATLFNMIAGLSVCLYEPIPLGQKLKRGESEHRFKSLLTKFYPWQNEPLKKSKATHLLYESGRNPLAHRLAMDGKGNPVGYRKWPLTELQIQQLEKSPARPPWAGQTISRQEQDASWYVICVPALYWGVHRMLHALFSDSEHMKKAEGLAPQYLEWLTT